MEGYLAELDRRKFTGNTLRREVASIRSFFAYLQDDDVVVSLAHKLIPPEQEHVQPRVLTEAEYQRLQLACRYEPRDGAIIEALLQTGMRLSDCPSRSRGTRATWVRCASSARGRRARTVILNWKACKALKSYLAIRPQFEGEPRLFLTKFQRGIRLRAIENVVGKYLAEARIAGASVHSLRHTFATHSVRKGRSWI